MTTTYIPCTLDDIPAGVRWMTPRHLQGQIVEVSYACPTGDMSEACKGDAYRRIIDRSDQSIEYARRDDVAPVKWLALGADRDSLAEFDRRTDAERWSLAWHGHDCLVQLDGDHFRFGDGMATIDRWVAVRALRDAGAPAGGGTR